MNNTYSVFGYSEDTGKISVDRVTASNQLQAFFKAAQKGQGLTFVACVNGELAEGVDYECPGEGVVDEQTILDQSDIFNQEYSDNVHAPETVEIEKSLLAALQHALNIIPNRRIDHGEYRDTYSLASAIGKL